MNFLGISLGWWVVIIVVVIIVFFLQRRDRPKSQQGYPGVIVTPVSELREKDVVDEENGADDEADDEVDEEVDEDNEEDNEDEEDERPSTWDDIKEHVVFATNFAIGDKDDWTWEARELDIMLEKGWALVAGDDNCLYFRKI